MGQAEKRSTLQWTLMSTAVRQQLIVMLISKLLPSSLHSFSSSSVLLNLLPLPHSPPLFSIYCPSSSFFTPSSLLTLSHFFFTLSAMTHASPLRHPLISLLNPFVPSPWWSVKHCVSPSGQPLCIKICVCYYKKKMSVLDDTG